MDRDEWRGRLGRGVPRVGHDVGDHRQPGHGEVLDFGIVPLAHLEHPDGKDRLPENPRQTSLAGGKIGELLNLHGQITVGQLDRLALLSLERQIIDPDPPRFLW